VQKFQSDDVKLRDNFTLAQECIYILNLHTLHQKQCVYAGCSDVHDRRGICIRCLLLGCLLLQRSDACGRAAGCDGRAPLRGQQHAARARQQRCSSCCSSSSRSESSAAAAVGDGGGASRPLWQVSSCHVLCSSCDRRSVKRSHMRQHHAHFQVWNLLSRIVTAMQCAVRCADSALFECTSSLSWILASQTPTVGLPMRRVAVWRAAVSFASDSALLLTHY
jgi:hypothetical protein